LQVIANGHIVPGALAAEVVSNNYYAADSFNVSIALATASGLGISFWSDESEIQVEIQFSIDSGMSYTSLLYGAVDAVSVDPAIGLLNITGRDLTASLIAARTQETFANRTSSEIATLLASRHSLTPQVANTTTPVGRYYQSEHDSLTLNQFTRATTEWDLLVFLARQENFNVFVQGHELYFQPSTSLNGVTLSLRPTDVTGLRLGRSLLLAQDIEVVVKSWNSRQNLACIQRATKTAAGSAASAASPQSYVYVKPNLTPQDASKFANQRLEELIRHARTVEIRMPGELTLSPRGIIALEGTGTSFDQTYYVDAIERRLDGHGFTQLVRGRSASSLTSAT
jgi:phage protein D